MRQKTVQEVSKGFGNPNRVLFNERCRGLSLYRAQWKSPRTQRGAGTRSTSSRGRSTSTGKS